MSEGSESDDRSSGRRWITLIATLVLITLGVGYATFAALYIANRTLTSPDAVLNAGRAPGTVTVTFIPQAIDPERENIRGVLKVTVDPPSTPQGVTVRLYPFLDVSEVVVPADTATVELDATLATEGEVRSYPFDDYTALVSISAFAGTDATTPVPVQGGVLPIDGLTGWNINASADLDPAPDVIKESVDVRRSLTTSVTTMILAGLVAALGLLALFLAWSVTVGRKRILFSEATWLAATIF